MVRSIVFGTAAALAAAAFGLHPMVSVIIGWVVAGAVLATAPRKK